MPEKITHVSASRSDQRKAVYTDCYLIGVNKVVEEISIAKKPGSFQFTSSSENPKGMGRPSLFKISATLLILWLQILTVSSIMGLTSLSSAIWLNLLKTHKNIVSYM